MPMKKTLNDNVAKTRAKVSQALNQARESLKLLEILEKETLAKAKTLVKNPLKSKRVKPVEAPALVTLEEFNLLKNRVAELEAQVETLKSAKATKSAGKSASASSKPQQAEALPQT
jgi:uncharacterized small protein (DUF1192 family)